MSLLWWTNNKMVTVSKHIFGISVLQCLVIYRLKYPLTPLYLQWIKISQYISALPIHQLSSDGKFLNHSCRIIHFYATDLYVQYISNNRRIISTSLNTVLLECIWLCWGEPISGWNIIEHTNQSIPLNFV